MISYYSLKGSEDFLNDQRYMMEITNTKVAYNGNIDKDVIVFNVRITDKLGKESNKVFGLCVDLDELVTVPITDQVMDSLVVRTSYQLKAKYRKEAIRRLWKPIIKNTHVYSTKDHARVSDL